MRNGNSFGIDFRLISIGFPNNALSSELRCRFQVGRFKSPYIMKIHTTFTLLSIFAVAALGQSQAATVLINGGFESPALASSGINGFFPQGDVPGWETTASDGLIEVWGDGFLTVPAYAGSQFAEINATQTGSLYQEVTIPIVGLVDYGFVHRARVQDGESLRVDVTYLGVDNLFGTADDVLVVDGGVVGNQFSSVMSQWTDNQVDDAFVSVAGGNYRFSFGSISGGTVGNFIDEVRFGVDAIPEPSSCVLLALTAGVSCSLRRRVIA